MAEQCSRDGRREFLLDRVKKCVKDLSKVDKDGKCRPVYEWSTGEKVGSGIYVRGLCRICFASCHEASHYLLDECCKIIRPDTMNHSASGNAFYDRTAVPDDKKFFKDIEELVQSKGISLSNEQKGLMLLPNAVFAIESYRWMGWYFKSYGDQVPNSDQINLEYIIVKSIWEEYKNDVGEERSLTYPAFLRLWHTCFPYVKVREYKQCCGKCMTCFKLSEARKLTKDHNKKTYVTMLHSLHRTFYMGERDTYAERRRLARMHPSLYMSTISDGMAQLHCLLPYFGNKYTVTLNMSISACYHILTVLPPGRYELQAAPARNHQPRTKYYAVQDFQQCSEWRQFIDSHLAKVAAEDL